MSTTSRNQKTDLELRPTIISSVLQQQEVSRAGAFWNSLLLILLPLEIIALASFAIAAIISLSFSVKFYYPNGQSTAFALNHYLVGFLLASATVSFVSWIRNHASASKQNRIALFRITRNAAAFSLIIFLHFNFKLWAQLVNPSLFDDFYQWTDQQLVFLREFLLFINYAFLELKLWQINAYHDVFVFMFFTSFLLFGVFPNARLHLGELASAVALVLVIGGLCYMVAPAWGPFVFSEHPGKIQKIMREFQMVFNNSGGEIYAGHNFISPLAAMPSLHTAHAFVLWYYAHKHLRWLGLIYLPFTVFIFTEAVASQWHYVVDLPFGLLVAFLSMYVAKRLHRQNGS